MKQRQQYEHKDGRNIKRTASLQVRMAVTGGGSIGKRGILDKPSWHLDAL